MVCDILNMIGIRVCIFQSDSGRISGGGRPEPQLSHLRSNCLVESFGGVQEAQSHRKGGNQMGLCIILHGKRSLGACWRIHMGSDWERLSGLIRTLTLIRPVSPGFL